MTVKHISTIRLLAYRFLAYIVDILLMLVCIGTLQFGFVYLTSGIVNESLTTSWWLHAWVLLTVTLPVFLYFVIAESFKRHATVGKKIFGLKVVSNKGDVTFKKSFIRNFIKVFIPWESAHIALFFPTPILLETNMDEVRWSLFIPYIILGIYGAYLLATKGRKTLHDAAAGTNVEKYNY